MRHIDRIVIHCSASGDVSVNTIRKWHLERGFRDTGYHFVIRQSGWIELGRPVEQSGAHARGYNAHSIGICLTGGKGGVMDYTEPQMDSLVTLVHGLVARHPNAFVCGHNDLTDAKTCPNFSVTDWWSKHV